MLMLDEAVYHVKMDFNQRFLALREVKKRVCHQLAEVQGRLRHALAALGKPTASVVDPVLKPEEMPELRDQVRSHSFTCLSPLPSVPSVHPSMHPSTHASIHLSVHSFSVIHLGSSNPSRQHVERQTNAK